VFNKFGALIKVCIHQGIKFREEFQDLCEKELINHHMISQNQVEANKLVEQMV
jgi:hypothetical protein